MQDFATVAQCYRPQVFRFLLVSMRDIDLAETLTQECFLKAHRGWPGFRGQSSVQSWLIRIAINLQNDHWRSRSLRFWKQARKSSLDIDLTNDWIPCSASSPEAQVSAREQRQVWRAVNRMTKLRRTVFVLRFVEQLPLKEIALATGLAESTIKSHLSRALGIVRSELRGDG